MPETALRPDNGGLAERIRGNPRMIGCASVNPALGGKAVKDFEEAVRAFGFRGVRLSPMAHGYPIDGAVVNPVMEQARALGVPVTVDGDGERCMPPQVGALAARFPGVTILADLGFRPHVTPPGTGEIIDVARRCPNLYLGFTALTASEPHHLQSVVAALGPERVAFGSNAPSGIPAFAVGGIRRAELGERAEALIFGGNLKRIYRDL
jgi:predicted TIM-barrel fold metal-dependent hydrolase